MRQPYNPNRTFWRDYWHGVHAMPRAWAIQGENLLHAFEAVASVSDSSSINFNCMDQAFMLAGMAIETMLKSILLAEDQVRTVVTGSYGRKRTGEAEKIWKVFFSHNLRGLAGAAGMGMTETQMDTIDVLSTFVIWRGRYVAPMERDIDDLLPIVGHDGLVHPPHIIQIEDVRTLLDVVISEVKRRLYSNT